MERVRPIENRSNGDRDAGGRFAKGNRGGPGNPTAKRTAALRKALLREIRPKDVRRLIRKMIELGRAGDVAAAKVVLDRALGRVPLDVDIVQHALEITDPDYRYI